MSLESTSLWGAEAGKVSPYDLLADKSTNVEKPKPVMVKPAKPFPAMKQIRWGAWDAILGMILLLVLQALVVGVVLIGDVMKNPDALVEEDFTAVLTPGLMLVSALSMYAAWGFSIMWASKRKGFGSLAKDFLVRFKWKHDLIFALVATIILRVTEQVVTFLVVNVGGFNIESSDNAGTVAAQEGIWWVINAVIVAAFLAPLFEELFFRGLFLQGLNRTLFRFGNKQRASRKEEISLIDTFIPMTFKPLRDIRSSGSRFVAWLSRHSVIISLIVSSTVFGFMHWPGTWDAGAAYLVAYTGALGLILGIMTLKYKRLGPSILTHIMFNFSGVILATILN